MLKSVAHVAARRSWGLIAGLVFVSGLTAAPLCTSFTGLTAAGLESLGGGGCQFGDKIFYNFTYTYSLQDSNGSPFGGDLNTPNVSGASVQVVFSNLGGNAWQPVMSFLANWQVSDGNAGDIRINYSVLAPPAGAMYYSSLAAFGSVSNVDPVNDFSSYVSIAETVCCPGGPAVILGVDMQAPVTTSPLTPTSATDSAFYTPSTLITISKDIFISSGTGGNQALLTRVDQGLFELSDVPEPLSCLLFGSGLTVIGLLRKRKLQTKS